MSGKVMSGFSFGILSFPFWVLESLLGTDCCWLAILKSRKIRITTAWCFNRSRKSSWSEKILLYRQKYTLYSQIRVVCQPKLSMEEGLVDKQFGWLCNVYFWRYKFTLKVSLRIMITNRRKTATRSRSPTTWLDLTWLDDRHAVA